MDLIADILLIAGALGAGIYCFVLARRLRRFTDLETGVGGAIAVLSVQVDDMTKALRAAQSSADATSGTLDALTARTDDAARRLELLVASMHDLPVDGQPRTGPADRAQDGRERIEDTAAPVVRPVAPTPAESGTSSESPPPDTPEDRSARPPTFFLSQRARIREAAE
jgi:hypothetical protein